MFPTDASVGASYDGPPAHAGRSLPNAVPPEWLNPADCQRRFAPARGNSFDPETMEFEAVAATETPVERRDARGPYLEILPMANVDLTRAEGVPLVDNHQFTGSVRSLIGVARKFRVEGDQLIFNGRLAQDDHTAPIAARMAAGFITHVSIGYHVASWAESTDAQGRRVRTATRWTVDEVSLVIRPADPNARIRHARNHERSIIVSDEVIESPPADEVERQRKKDIRALVRTAGLPSETADDLIDSGVDLTAAKAAVYDTQLARGRSQPIIRSHAPANDDPAVLVRRQSAALAYRMGGGDLPDDAKPFVETPLLDMARASVERMGVSTRGLSRDEILQRSAHTTSDFPLVVSNAMGKTALDSYRAAESPLKQLCRRQTLNDFKTTTAIRLGELGQLEEMSESGEFTATSRAESGESMALKTYGRRIDLSRNLIINDDLNLLGDMTRAFGEAAAQTEADVLVSLITDNPDLSDGTAVFDASRGNIGAVGAGSVVSLGAAREAMRTRTGLDGKTIIDAKPTFLVVPAGGETEAEQLLASIYAATVGDVNPFSGTLKLLVEPRLPDSVWYLFTDPARLATMRYAYLGSAQGVQIQRREAWDTLGLSFRAFLDFGAGWLDWRGAHQLPQV